LKLRSTVATSTATITTRGSSHSSPNTLRAMTPAPLPRPSSRNSSPKPKSSAPRSTKNSPKAATVSSNSTLTIRPAPPRFWKKSARPTTDHEEGDVSLDASQAYVEGFPSIPAEGGMLATYSRTRAISREDIRFLSADHPLVQDTIDLLINSATGTTAFCLLESDTPNLLLEAVFVLETIEDTRWHLDQFLPPTPLRVLVDIHGRDRSAELSPEAFARDLEDAPLPQFLEKPGFNATLLKNLLERATELAEARATPLRQAARETAATTLTDELQRLVHLSKLNTSVSPREIELAKKQVRQTRKAIEASRLRLDSIRLIR